MTTHFGRRSRGARHGTGAGRRILTAVTAAIVCAGLASALEARQLVPSHAPSSTARPAFTEVARVNGMPLMSDRLDAALNALLPQESFHRSVGAARLAELRKKALDTIVDEELEFQEAVRLGLRVTTAEIDVAVAQTRKTYPGPRGFDTALERAGVKMADVRREIRRSLTIDKARARQVTARCGVTVAEARRFFTDHPDKFVVPEQLHVFAITIGVDPSSATRQWDEARTRAEGVLSQIRSGASFEETARLQSTDRSRDTGGDMGYIHRGSLVEAFDTATRDLPVGQVSDVVKSIYGYHLVRVADVRPPSQKTFAEVGAGLRRDLEAKRCEDTEAAWIARLRRDAPIELVVEVR